MAAFPASLLRETKEARLLDHKYSVSNSEVFIYFKPFIMLSQTNNLQNGSDVCKGVKCYKQN